MKTMTGWKNERMNEYIRPNIDPNVGKKKPYKEHVGYLKVICITVCITLGVEHHKHTKSYSKIHTWHVWSYLVLLSRRVFTWSSNPDNLIAIPLSHELGDVSVQLKLQRPQVLCYPTLLHKQWAGEGRMMFLLPFKWSCTSLMFHHVASSPTKGKWILLFMFTETCKL